MVFCNMRVFQHEGTFNSILVPRTCVQGHSQPDYPQPRCRLKLTALTFFFLVPCLTRLLHPPVCIVMPANAGSCMPADDTCMFHIHLTGLVKVVFNAVPDELTNTHLEKDRQRLLVCARAGRFITTIAFSARRQSAQHDWPCQDEADVHV